MPSCVIKVCRNYKGRLKTTHNVTYHRIPSDPIMKSRWVDIIRKSRGEDLWQPAKTTIICSDHFHEKDMYFVRNQNRRRLKKEAIPNKALFLSSLKSDESENSDEDKRLPSKALFTLAAQSCESGNSNENMELPSKNSLASVEDSSAAIFAKDAQPQPSTSVKNNDDNVGDFSDLDSIFDTPQEAKLRKELCKKILIQKKHTRKIQSLRKKNVRLKKKIASYKQILQTLKKERYINMDTHNVLCGNVMSK